MARPLLNVSDAVHINISAHLLQILDVVSSLAIYTSSITIASPGSPLSD
jgi:hypothetical protein